MIFEKVGSAWFCVGMKQTVPGSGVSKPQPVARSSSLASPSSAASTPGATTIGLRSSIDSPGPVAMMKSSISTAADAARCRS